MGSLGLLAKAALYGEAPAKPEGHPAEQPSPAKASRIGVYRESSLHESLKIRYAGDGGTTETAVAGFVCDAIRTDGLIVEVQTGSFGPLKQKLAALAAQGPVCLVHPIALERVINLSAPDGSLIRSRKSPAKGSAFDLFKALVYAPSLPLLPNLRIEIVYTKEVEQRVDDGKGSWRRKGVSKKDRELVAILATERLHDLQAYVRFIPKELGEEFTVAEFAKAAKIRPAIAGKAVYVLRHIGALSEAEKKGRAKRYRRSKNVPATGGSEP